LRKIRRKNHEENVSDDESIMSDDDWTGDDGDEESEEEDNDEEDNDEEDNEEEVDHLVEMLQDLSKVDNKVDDKKV